MRRIVYREMEKQTSLLCREDQRSSVDGTTFVFSLERKIIIMTGGVGGRIALLCLGWIKGAVCIQYLRQSHEGRLGKWKVLSLSFGQWVTIKGFKLRNDNISERLFQYLHEEWVGSEVNMIRLCLCVFESGFCGNLVPDFLSAPAPQYLKEYCLYPFK